MRALLNLLPLAGCGLMMAACMGLMGRGRTKQPAAQSGPDAETELRELRAEVEALRTELDAERARG